LDHSKAPLFEALNRHINNRVIPFDVPGHKQGHGNSELRKLFPRSVLEADVNSMKPLDFICNPVSVIAGAEALLADAFNADHAFMITNGTTQAVQAMVMSCVSDGDTIILPRNVHKSAINALILCGAKPHYIYPAVEASYGMTAGVSLEDVKKAIAEAPQSKAILLINPTYYGVVSELKSIVSYAHSKGILVLVDEAHGAHFAFHEGLPPSAMDCGADMAAVSVHKTGGSLTQSSVLLLKNARVSKDHVRAVLNITQSTSASYLLMTSLDLTRRFLVQEGRNVLTNVIDLAAQARRTINNIDGLLAYDRKDFSESSCFGFDTTKLGVNVTGIGLTGLKVYDILRDEFNIQVELGDSHNIMAILSVGDTSKRVNQFSAALQALAFQYRKKPLILNFSNFHATEVILSPRKAFYSDKIRKPLRESIGRISGEFVMIYPPGIPILAPGEKISEEMIAFIELLKSEQGTMSGLEDPKAEHILCIK
jgi:arginine decarboxylase